MQSPIREIRKMLHKRVDFKYINVSPVVDRNLRFNKEISISPSHLSRPTSRQTLRGLGASMRLPRSLHLCPQAHLGWARTCVWFKTQFLGSHSWQPLGAWWGCMLSAPHFLCSLRLLFLVLNVGT